ncbi:MAG: hypothetical protein R2855_05720 [Thermomicrobiales bacterium]
MRKMLPLPLQLLNHFRFLLEEYLGDDVICRNAGLFGDGLSRSFVIASKHPDIEPQRAHFLHRLR